MSDGVTSHLEMEALSALVQSPFAKGRSRNSASKVVASVLELAAEKANITVATLVGTKFSERRKYVDDTTCIVVDMVDKTMK
jgi:serine/threonine protein phosphatase PrpC